jgi:plastocyanin
MRMSRWTLIRSLPVAAAIAVAAGCSKSDSPVTPSPSPPNSITITSAGVSPKTLTVARGSQVTFVNNDSRRHDVASDPHPEHTDCPEINSVGVLNPQQNRQTGNLVIARSCGFHDHEDPLNASLRGTIVVQ